MKRFNQINMIPFIDIMLVLLAIVLTTATFVSQGLIDVNLPKAEEVSEPVPKQEEPLQISIDENGDLFFGEKKIAYDELKTKLADVDKAQFIVLRIDKQAAFEQFVKILDPLKAGEFTNLSIQAEQAD
ncbi:MAG TPA: TonB system transport protein ExbD [Thiolinea sp.]|nr:TonB system transport protein ExbD [Thiolinea sp.]